MNYTKETTIEEYQAWLDTNPPLYQIRRVSRKVFQLIYEACDVIDRICKRVRSRSSISAAYMYQVAQSRENRTAIQQQLMEVDAIISMVNRELDEDIDGISAYHAQHQRIMEKLHDELAMEELLSQAHEIIYQRTN